MCKRLVVAQCSCKVHAALVCDGLLRDTARSRTNSTSNGHLSPRMHISACTYSIDIRYVLMVSMLPRYRTTDGRKRWNIDSSPRSTKKLPCCVSGANITSYKAGGSTYSMDWFLARAMARRLHLNVEIFHAARSSTMFVRWSRIRPMNSSTFCTTTNAGWMQAKLALALTHA